MAVTNKSQLASATATQQALYNQEMARQAKLNNQQKYYQMAQQDPWFAFGNLLGNALVDNYNSRGVNKEKKAISDALASYQGNQDYNQLTNILESPTIQNASQSLVAPATVSGGTGDTLGTNVNPEITQESITAPQIQTPSINTFEEDKFKAKFYEDARKRGRSDAQINEAWASMQPQITELANKAKEARLDAAFSAMQPDEDGKYSFGEVSMSNPQFINFMRPVMKDNPELATYLMKGAIAKDTSNAALARQNNANMAKANLQAQNQKFQLGMNNINNAIKLEAARIRAGNKNNNGADSQRYKNIKAKLDELNVIENGDGLTVKGRELTQKEKQQKAILEREANAYLYGTVLGNTGKENAGTTPAQVQYKQPSINQYSQELVDDIGKGIATLSAKNWPKDKIIAAIKNMYANQIAANGGGAGYIDQILQEVDWGEDGYNVRGR